MTHDPGLDPDAYGTALSRLTHHLQPKSLVSDQHPVDWVSLPRKIGGKKKASLGILNDDDPAMVA
jgi:hypothetical protein